MSALRTLNYYSTDPDYRNIAKVRPCVICGKRCRENPITVHLINGGKDILHPSSESDYVPDSGDLSFLPIGPDCARKIGMEWVHQPNT